MTFVDVEHFRARVLQDALNEASAMYWRRRAAMFEWAKPRRGDDRGRRAGLPPLAASDIAAASTRCTSIAAACRARAQVAQVRDDRIEVDIWTALTDEAEGDLRAALDSGHPDAIAAAAHRFEALERMGAIAA